MKIQLTLLVGFFTSAKRLLNVKAAPDKFCHTSNANPKGHRRGLALVNKVTDVPISGSRLKFILDNRWSLTQTDTTTGAVLYHHGGSYTFDGKIYTEQVEFANSNTASYIKSTAKFTVQIEGNVMTLIGIGNPWNEIWVRLKSN